MFNIPDLYFLSLNVVAAHKTGDISYGENVRELLRALTCFFCDCEVLYRSNQEAQYCRTHKQFLSCLH